MLHCWSLVRDYYEDKLTLPECERQLDEVLPSWRSAADLCSTVNKIMEREPDEDTSDILHSIDEKMNQLSSDVWLNIDQCILDTLDERHRTPSSPRREISPPSSPPDAPHAPAMSTSLAGIQPEEDTNIVHTDAVYAARIDLFRTQRNSLSIAQMRTAARTEDHAQATVVVRQLNSFLFAWGDSLKGMSLKDQSSAEYTRLQLHIYFFHALEAIVDHRPVPAVPQFLKDAFKPLSLRKF